MCVWIEVTSVLRKMKSQSRDSMASRKPHLLRVLGELGDFYLELKWDFHSWSWCLAHFFLDNNTLYLLLQINHVVITDFDRIFTTATVFVYRDLAKPLISALLKLPSPSLNKRSIFSPAFIKNASIGRVQDLQMGNEFTSGHDLGWLQRQDLGTGRYLIHFRLNRREVRRSAHHYGQQGQSLPEGQARGENLIRRCFKNIRSIRACFHSNAILQHAGKTVAHIILVEIWKNQPCKSLILTSVPNLSCLKTSEAMSAWVTCSAYKFLYSEEWN